MCQLSGKSVIFYFFCPNLPENWFWDQNFENVTPDSESPLPKYHLCLFSGKTDNFDFFSANLPKNECWGQNFKNVYPASESAPPRTMCSNFQAKQAALIFSAQTFPKTDLGLGIQKANVRIRISILKIPCVPIFSQNGQFDFFSLNLGKLPNYMQYFSSNNVEGVAESWVEAKLTEILSISVFLVDCLVEWLDDCLIYLNISLTALKILKSSLSGFILILKNLTILKLTTKVLFYSFLSF